MLCLIVDDNQPFLEAARVLLERQGLTIAGVASNAAEALRKFERLQPDVVLVDIWLGTESGLELARQLAESEHPGGAAVVLISTHATDDVADLIADSPATDFLPKSDLSGDAIRRIVDVR